MMNYRVLQPIGRTIGEVIKTWKSVEDPVCGGAIYIKFRNNKGQTAYGWVFSDVLVMSIED
jgi:hypothetical protein